MNERDLAALQGKAVELLEAHEGGLPYRDLVHRLIGHFPQLGRLEVSQAVGDLPRTLADRVWRPKPGIFALRKPGDYIPRGGRPRKIRSAVEATAPPKWPERPLPNRMENLLRIGFEEVGAWSRTAQGLECQYEEGFDPKHLLLAYVMSDNVMYIGRLRGPGEPVQRNGHVLRAIRNALNRDRPVRIFALLKSTPCEHAGIRVNVGAGIEDELVERMQPPWNSF